MKRCQRVFTAIHNEFAGGKGCPVVVTREIIEENN